MTGPCFCRPDLLSQCVAGDYQEQMSCRFFIISGCGNKCMYRNEQLDNHCWQPDAQSMGLCSEEEVEIELGSGDEEEEGWELKEEEAKTCIDCVNYKCMKLTMLAHQAPIARRGLTFGDLDQIADKCDHFDKRPEV